jgi:hypothetical protein
MSRARENRDYVITHNWLDKWEGSCPGCGEFKSGSLAEVFALLWKHRKCQGETA